MCKGYHIFSKCSFSVSVTSVLPTWGFTVHHIHTHTHTPPWLTHSFLISSRLSDFSTSRHPLLTFLLLCDSTVSPGDRFRETNLIFIYMSGHLSVLITPYQLSFFTGTSNIPSFFVTMCNCISEASPLFLTELYIWSTMYTFSGFCFTVGAYFVKYEAVARGSSPVSYTACPAAQMGWLSGGEATTRPFCELRATSPPRSVRVPLSSAKAETIHLSCATISTRDLELSSGAAQT